MKGSETKMTGFMEGADKRYVIPVYQRKYDWKTENCRQLYEDLKKVVLDGRESHFFGSIVSLVVPDGSKIEYHIIDGQQRLTTISLLLLAISNLIKQDKVQSKGSRLDEQILNRFLIDPWDNDAPNVIKLRPVKSDRAALSKLYGDPDDYDWSSNLTQNYKYFCDMVLREEVTVDDLYAAVGKLEIICITLDQGDNAQLIFESLNSTGLALTEGDKIRNYVLMGLSPKMQNECYDIWVKIENYTANNVSGFVRDYLSIKQGKTPTVNSVYPAFKNYFEEIRLPVKDFLTDLLEYSRLYNKLLTCHSGLHSKELNDCLYRLSKLEIVVTNPFFMEVLWLNMKGKLLTEDVLTVFSVTENYLFRRNICDVPTNALNKIFLNLNKEIIRYDNTTNNYVDKFIYALLSKKESGRFPDNEEFAAALSTKQVYQMRGKYKAYLFERFENYGTVETKDVYTHLENKTYSIEHIMPQHLTPAWMEDLGPNYAEIHATWLHRLANLTLTAYNPNLSNSSFLEKCEHPEGGYKMSGLRMNQKIALCSSWGLPELEKRDHEMVELAKTIWSYPETAFKPVEKELDSCSLDDDDVVDLTGRDIARYSYQNIERPASSWADMYENVIRFLHQNDRTVLSKLAYSTDTDLELTRFVSNIPDRLTNALKIDENIYVEKHTSTAMKMSILRRFFAAYHADPMDLVFYLKDKDENSLAEGDRHEIRMHFWTYAVPIIKNANLFQDAFNGSVPTTSNTIYGTWGVSGYSINCIANYDQARVDLYMGSGNTVKNKASFDALFAHKEEIEQELGIDLEWNRADKYKASWICYRLNDVSIANESDWPRMAKFHAEWSARFGEVLLPYLQQDTDDKATARLQEIAGIFREWTVEQPSVRENIAKSNRTCTRFTTQGMSEILPDIQNAPSAWGTDNHYFYEIVNRTGNTAFIQFAISAKNITPELRQTCDVINKFYPAKYSKKEDWKWRTPFKTSTISFEGELSKESIFAKLDGCLQEIADFERDLKLKLGLL